MRATNPRVTPEINDSALNASVTIVLTTKPNCNCPNNYNPYKESDYKSCPKSCVDCDIGQGDHVAIPPSGRLVPLEPVWGCFRDLHEDERCGEDCADNRSLELSHTASFRHSDSSCRSSIARLSCKSTNLSNSIFPLPSFHTQIIH